MSADGHRENFFTIYTDVMSVYGMVDRAVNDVVQLITRSGEHRIACRRGCNTCCTAFVRATFAEAAAIVHRLLDASNLDGIGFFLEKITSWRKSAGPEVEMLEALATGYHIRLDSGSESQLFAEAVRTYHGRRLMCPFNADDGSCCIHPLRPVVCRTFLVTGTSGTCRFDSNGEIAAVHHEKLAETALLGQSALREISIAAGNGTITALPLGVRRAVAILEGDDTTDYLQPGSRLSRE